MSFLKEPLLVVGAGAWGTALALLLHTNHVPVRLWCYDPQQSESMNALHENVAFLPGITLPADLLISPDLEQLLEGIQDILIVVPSGTFSETLHHLKKIRPQGLRIALGTKGVDPQSNLLLHDVITQHYGSQTSIAVLSGPSFAKEVALGLPTAVNLTGNDSDFNQSLIARLSNSVFNLYLQDDIIGMELCSVVKNALAIIVGMSDGLGFGMNARSAIMTRGLAELARLCIAAGGKAETVLSLAGIGDVVLTCTDDQSRNRRFGLALAQNRDSQQALSSIGQAVEGYANAKQLYQLSIQYAVDMPIIQSLYEILYEQADIKERLMSMLSHAS